MTAIRGRLDEIDALSERIESVEDDLDSQDAMKPSEDDDSLDSGGMALENIAAKIDLDESQSESLLQKTLEYKQEMLDLMQK